MWRTFLWSKGRSMSILVWIHLEFLEENGDKQPNKQTHLSVLYAQIVSCLIHFIGCTVNGGFNRVDTSLKIMIVRHTAESQETLLENKQGCVCVCVNMSSALTPTGSGLWMNLSSPLGPSSKSMLSIYRVYEKQHNVSIFHGCPFQQGSQRT